MKNSQLNKIKMYDTVKSVIAEHQATWNNTPAFTNAFDEFSTKLDILKSISNDHINSSKGVTTLKKMVLVKTVEQALVLGNVLKAFALDTGDTELMMRNVFSRSEWFRGNALLKVSRFKNLLTDASTHETAILEYGIDAAFIQAFEAKVLEFEGLTKETRISIVSKKHMTQEIAAMIKDIDELLNNRISKIITVFSFSHPKFVALYTNAHNIVDYRGKRSKFESKDVPEEPDDGDDAPKGLF